MFQKENFFILKEEFKEDEKVYTVNIFYHGQLAGQAIYRIRDDENIHFSWLETNKDFQRIGIASKLVDYLSEKAINESRSLIINVVDEAVLIDFYLNWFIKRVNQDDEYDINDVKEHFYDAVPNEGMYFNDNHPTLVLTAEDLKWKPTQKAKNTSGYEYSYFRNN